MYQHQKGILADKHLKNLIEKNVLQASFPIEISQIQPASLDLRLGKTAYRVCASFMPGPKKTVLEKMQDVKMQEFDLTKGVLLEKGAIYIIPLLESLALPLHLSGSANPKSSTGRLDVFVRLITDYGQEFDKVVAGYKGALYLEISPQTFPIIARCGSRLSQLRLCAGDNSRLDTAALMALQEQKKLINSEDININEDGTALSVDLKNFSPQKDSALGALIGYKAKRHCAPIDIDEKASAKIADYWDPIFCTGNNHSLILDPGEFYILASQEEVMVPDDFAAEMCPFNPLVGEFRVHYAGFFDPGFGVKRASSLHSSPKGARAVLEVRSREVPFLIEHGQRIGRLLYHPMLDIPELPYGSSSGSHYQAQGLKLSKHFC